VIDLIYYRKELAAFTFEDFIGSLTKNYNELEWHGEFVSEDKKVWDMLAKISDPSLDSKINQSD